METSIVNEWLAFQQSIRARFRTLAGVDHRGYTEQLQYAVFPSFADYRRLDILSPTQGGKTIAFRTTWDFNRDLAAFSTPVERMKHSTPYSPTLTTERIDVKSDRLSRIIDALADISIPLNANHCCGLDGTSYELQLGSSFGWCRIKWWVSLPREWKPIAKTVQQLDKFLTLGAASESIG